MNIWLLLVRSAPAGTTSELSDLESGALGTERGSESQPVRATKHRREFSLTAERSSMVTGSPLVLRIRSTAFAFKVEFAAKSSTGWWSFKRWSREIVYNPRQEAE